jgi:hypothetical protein
MVEDDSGKVEIFMAIGNESDGGERAVENTTFSWMKTTPRFTFLSQELPSDKQRQKKLHEDTVGKCPPDLFFLMFDGMVDLIQKETNRYAKQNNDHRFHVTEDEIKCFLGIFLLSGYNEVPEIKHYWSLEKDLRNPLLKSTIYRSHFQEIKSYLYRNNNSKVKGSSDKLFKLLPYLHLFSRNIIRFVVFSTTLSVGESMVPYFGRFGSIMFIKGKPVRLWL